MSNHKNGSTITVRKSARTAIELCACGDHIRIISTKENGRGQLIATGSGMSIPFHAVDDFVAAIIKQREQGAGK
jgi:hypothetical protein